ncbi:hypothetical protein [Campylobacter sp. 19-13652]|uniref:hypothetical protein n=1 Tax=Campylobacter sp. 19-13652 TaxID=2840180 RepID=UPI001C772F3A|nr:hypothetical protein [Campylobacter sp. 19-13652]BCX78679.1 hypothetical protein LBC_01410 [Campylobacter sp. 19-13652]
MAQKGKVTFLNGTAISKDSNGRDRLLKVGDVVFSGDTITMGGIDGTKAIILMENGREYVLIAGDVVRLRGESPVNENFDAAAVLKALLEQDAHRTEKMSDEYHNDKTRFSQSGKKTDISTNVTDIHTNAGGESSGRMYSDDRAIIKTGHFTQLTRSVNDVNKNIIEVFNYQAGEKNNIKTSSIASTSPAIKQSSQAPIQETKEPTPPPTPQPMPNPEPKPTPMPEPEPIPEPTPIPEPEPTPPTPITPPPAIAEFKATSISFKSTYPNLERFDLGVSKNKAVRLEISTSGDSNQSIVVYVKDAQNVVKKVANLTQNGSNSQEIALSNTDLSLGDNKIVAFTSSGNETTDMTNAGLIFANNSAAATNAKATSVRELMIVDTPPQASYDTTLSKSELSINLPSLSANKALDKITINLKAPSDTANTSHEIILTPNSARTAWSVDSISILDTATSAKTPARLPYALSTDRLSLPYDALAKSNISTSVSDLFLTSSASSNFDLVSQAIGATMQFYSDEKVEDGIVKQNISSQNNSIQEVLINGDKTTDSTLKLKLNITGSIGGDEIIVYEKSNPTAAPTIAGKASLAQGITTYDLSLNLPAQNDTYKFIAIAHDSAKAAPSVDFINSAFSGTNGAITVSSQAKGITVLPVPNEPELILDSTNQKISISLSDEPFVNVLSVSYKDTNGANQTAKAVKANGVWSLETPADGFSISGSTLEINTIKITIKAPVLAYNLNDLGVKSNPNIAIVSANNINKFIDTGNTQNLDTELSNNGNYISQDTTPTLRVQSSFGNMVAIYSKDEVSGEIKLVNVDIVTGTFSPINSNLKDIPLSGLEKGHNYKFIVLNVPVDTSKTTPDNFKSDASFAPLRDKLLAKASEYIQTGSPDVQSLHVQLKQLVAVDERVSKFNSTSGEVEFKSTLDENDVKVYVKEADGSLEPVSQGLLFTGGVGIFNITNNDPIKQSTTIINQGDKIGAKDYGLKGYVYGLSDANGSLFTNINGGKTQIESSLGSETNKFSIAANSSNLYLKTGEELSLDYFSDNGASKIASMNDTPSTAQLKAQGGMFEFIGADFSSLSDKTPDVIAMQQKGSVNTHLSSGVSAPDYVYLHYAKSGKSVNILKINDDTRLEVISIDGMAEARASDNVNQNISSITISDDGNGVVKFHVANLLSDDATTKFELTRAISKDALADISDEVLDLSVGFGDANGEIVSLGDNAGGVDMRAIFSTDFETKGGVNFEVSDPAKYASDNKLNSIVYYDGPENDGLLSSDSGKVGGLYTINTSNFNLSQASVITGRENQQDNITGSAGNDFIDGMGSIDSSNFNMINAIGGDDIIVYHDGDVILGGDGTDTVIIFPDSYSNVSGLSGIEKISLGDYTEAGINNGGNYSISLGDIFNIQDANKTTLTIDGDEKDTLTIQNDSFDMRVVDANDTNASNAQGYTHYKVSSGSSHMYLDIDENIILTQAI